MRDHLFDDIYSEGFMTHSGRDKTISLMEERYYWGYLRKEVSNMIKKCHVFKSSKEDVHNVRPYLPLHISSTIWEELSMDFILNLRKVSQSVNFILIVVDIF